MQHGGGVDTEQIAGYIVRGHEFAAERCVDSMIIVRREVQRHVRSVTECARIIQIGSEQIVKGVVMPLGLKNTVRLQFPGLGHGAVDGRHDRHRPCVNRSRAVLEFADEEVVECAKGVRDITTDLVDIDAIEAHESADERILDGFYAYTRDTVDDCRQPMSRQQILHESECARQHLRINQRPIRSGRAHSAASDRRRRTAVSRSPLCRRGVAA